LSKIPKEPAPVPAEVPVEPIRSKVLLPVAGLLNRIVAPALAAVDVSISIIRNGTDTYLAKTISVPADATQVISTKETYFYLEENVGIRAQASSANGIDVTISYEEIS
jgi:hypothetical protein